MTLPSWLAIGYLALIDLPNRLSLGPTTLSGVITVGLGLLGMLLVGWFVSLNNRRSRATYGTESRAFPAYWWLFLLWAASSLFIHPSAAGIQNISVWIAFTLAATSATVTATRGNTDQLLLWTKRVAVVASAGYLVAAFAFTHDTSALYGGRSFAMTALIFLAVLVPTPRLERGSLWIPTLVFVALIVSQSRTALAIGALILMALVTRTRKKGRALKSIFLAGAVSGLAVFLFRTVDTVRERFVAPGDAALMVGGITVNTSGRLAFWEALWTSAQQAPFTGHGLGTSVLLIEKSFPGQGQPHNDYLRLLHDLGWPGVILFTAAWVHLLIKTLRRARGESTPAAAHIHWSAFISLLTVAILALTDNVIVYIFVLVPIGVLLGSSNAIAAASIPRQGPQDRRTAIPRRE